MKTRTQKHIAVFQQALREAGFSRFSTTEKQKFFKRMGMKFPKRITGSHHVQQMHVFERDGYRVVVHTRIIGTTLLSPGFSWVLITNDTERLFVRAFRSDESVPTETLLLRMLAYALVFKNMITYRPLDEKTLKLKRLVEKEEIFVTKKGENKRRLTPFWVSVDGTEEPAFLVTHLEKYLQAIPKNLQEFFFEKERKLSSYYVHRTGVYFRKEIRKKAKSTRPENSLASV